VKIVSLLPSATDVVAALGLQDQLCGRTWECDAPGVVHVPIVSWTGLPEGMAPAEIDVAVSERVADGSPLYRLDAELLAAIDPDLILTQDLCRVCAVPSGDVDDALSTLGCTAEVLSLDPATMAEVLADVLRVGEATGRMPQATAVVDGLQGRLDVVADAVAGRRPPRTLLLEWSDPPFGPGHWLPQLVEAAGGQPVLATPGGPSKPRTWEEVADAGADAVVVVPCGMGIDEAERQAQAVADHDGIVGTRLAAADGIGHFVRPGPGVVASVEALAAFLHPGALPERPEVVHAIGTP
jgi:iron complex transport system substrate-binding protein